MTRQKLIGLLRDARAEYNKPYDERDYSVIHHSEVESREYVRDAVKKWLKENGLEYCNTYLDMTTWCWQRKPISITAIGIYNSNGSISGRNWMNKIVVKKDGLVRAHRALTDPEFLMDGKAWGFVEFAIELMSEMHTISGEVTV